MSLTHITTHKEQMLARLLFQYKDKPVMQKVFEVLAARYQGLEDAFWQLATLRHIDTGEGVQLDIIGKIIRQERGDSADDAAYRLRLQARMRVNQSSGTVEDILAVFAALLGGYSNIELTQYFPAALILRISDLPVTEAVADLYASFLRAARLGGVSAYLQSSPTDDANTLTCCMSTRLAADFDPGAATMHVESTAGFDESGYLLFLPGDTNQWRISYTYKTATTFEGLSEREGVAVGQSDGDLVVQQSSPCSELAVAVVSPAVIAIALVSVAGFPASGFVSVGPIIQDSAYRIFHYNSILGTALRGVSDTGIGAGTSFAIGQIVSVIHKNFNADEQAFGGQLSSVREA